MDTSFSGNSTPIWSGAASLFSGRPDPEWAVSNADAAELLRIWESLPPTDRTPPPPPGLGYRGVTLREAVGGGEWSAFARQVTLRRGERRETRSDDAGLFEGRLAASAPPEVRQLIERAQEP